MRATALPFTCTDHGGVPEGGGGAVRDDDGYTKSAGAMVQRASPDDPHLCHPQNSPYIFPGGR